ncbi:MAG: cyclic nucleotide-binding domain-containing protein [Anaerolineae bacterium]|jgi:CRP-like cAMP-binding protein|nr:cyclic nucleotide-binding domain-containing protein [Anaerolineae bacterium]
MRKVLYILGELTDSDIAWMIEVGEKKVLPGEAILIREGQVAEGLYMLLSGTLVVVSPSGKEIARLERGEMVGEMSVLEARTPSVTVKTATPAQVLLIPRLKLQKRLETHEGFAAHFYKAIALFLSDRLRSTTAQLTADGRPQRPTDTDELDEKVLDNVYLAGTRFEAMLKRLIEGR